MTDLRKAAEMALDALKYHTEHTYPFHLTNVAIEALQKALTQPEQTVVHFPSFMRKRIEEAIDLAINPRGMSVHDGKAKVHASDLHRMLLCIDSTPPKREWVGLTDDEIAKAQIDFDLRGLYRYTRAIEAQCKELNG